MNNGKGPNSNSGHDDAPGPFKNGVFADGLPPGLEDLPPGLMAMLEAMSGESPGEDDETPPENEDGSGGEQEDGDDEDQAFVFNGTPGDDTFEGTDANERIKGKAGDDILSGGDGDDDLEGGPGNDTLDGGAGNDELKGGPGDDELSGGGGNDVLIAGPGNDLLMGGEGDDVYVFGGSPEPIPEGAPDEEASDEDSPDDDSPDEEAPEQEPSEDEGEPLAASAAAKGGNGKSNAGGNGKGKGNADGQESGDDDEDDEDHEDQEDVISLEDDSEDSQEDDSSEEPENDSNEEPDDEPDDEGGDESEGDGDEDEDADEGDEEDDETGLAWGENIIDDSDGNEIVRFDGEARSVLQQEQDGPDLVLSAGNGSLRIIGYFDNPGRWTFEDDLGVFDPTDDGEGEPPAEDPGDTIETSTPVESGFETTGDVGFEEDAADVFALTATEDGDVVVTLTGLSGTAHLRLLDSEGAVQAEASAMDGVETLVVPVTGGTEHFLEVTDGGDGGAEYGLSVDFTPDWGDTFETATPVDMIDGWAFTATVGFGDDAADFARITPEADGTLVLEADGGDNDPTIVLFNADGDVIAEGTQNGFGENRLEFDLTGGESYVVAIEPDGVPSTYTAGSSYSVTPDEGESPAVVETEAFVS
jgi:hypothetical protein